MGTGQDHSYNDSTKGPVRGRHRRVRVLHRRYHREGRSGIKGDNIIVMPDSDNANIAAYVLICK